MTEKEKIVVELVEQQPVKKPLLERMVYRVIGPGGLKDTMGSAMKSIILPGLKNLAADALHGAVNSIFYRDGGAPSERQRSGGYYDYGRSYRGGRETSRYSNVSIAGGSSRRPKDYAIIVEQDAYDIIDDLRDIISERGEATIADYYDMIGIPTGSYDDSYGWTSLGGARVVTADKGWVIEFPPTKRLSGRRR